MGRMALHFRSEELKAAGVPDMMIRSLFFNRNKNISYNEIIIYGGINMRILAIFGLVFGVIIVKEYLVDMITQYYVNKEKEAKRQHILNMKL